MKRNKTVTLKSFAKPAVIEAAHLITSKGKRSKRSVRRFEEHKKENSAELAELVASGNYQAGEYVSDLIMDAGKEREIMKSCYHDHIVRRAFMMKVEPILHDSFTLNTHAAIPGRGIHTALRQTRAALLHDPENTKYCLKLDVRKFFASVDRTILKIQFSRRFADKDLIEFANTLIDSPPGEKGIPIGNYPSQWFANMYLSDFDHWIKEKLRVPYYVRYMDDMVILAADPETLRTYLREIAWYFISRLNITIKGNWQIFETNSRGIDFVGYRIWSNKVILRKSTFKRLRRVSTKMKSVAEKRGYLSTSEQSKLFAYVGWAMYCTPKARMAIYRKYFAPIIKLCNIDLNKKMKEAYSQ
jgi:retron-type reverse transcriptase